MQYLKNFWQLLGNNSGQIQTLIGVVAIVLAVVAAVFARKQILMAQNQRLTELKLSILNTAYECKELYYSVEHKNEKLKTCFGKLLALQGRTLDDTVDGCDYNFHEYFKFPLKLLDTPREVTDKIIKSISDKENQTSLQDLERYLEALVKAKGSFYTSNMGYDRRIEDLNNLY